MNGRRCDWVLALGRILPAIQLALKGVEPDAPEGTADARFRDAYLDAAAGEAEEIPRLLDDLREAKAQEPPPRGRRPQPDDDDWGEDW